MRLFPRIRQQRRQQRGSVIVTALIAVSLIVITLIGTELGYLFYLKREFQKSSDLAALAGAQALTDNSCTEAAAAAVTNSGLNLPVGYQLTTADVTCGRWDPASLAAPRYFAAGAVPFNAVQVNLQRTPPILLTGISGGLQRQIKVEAMAVRDDPAAVFTVGSKLIQNNPNGALMSVLQLAGVNVNQVCVSCYTGLATVNINSGDFLRALGIPVTADLTVGQLNTLLAAKSVSVGQIVNVIATLAGQSTVAAANVALLNAISLTGIDVNALLIQVGSNTAPGAGPQGLFTQIQAPSSSAALNTQINAFSLLQTALGVGTSSHALTLGTTVNALGLGIEARVIEPPSIGLGGVGATAYNSQIRVYATINTTASALGGILSTLGTKINIPLSIDVSNGYGTLQNINCSASPPTATVQVNSPILSACIGQIATTDLWSKTDVCKTNLQSMSLVQVLGTDLLYGKAAIPALNNNDTLTLAAGETKTTSGNPLAIGTTVANTLSELLKLLLGGSGSGGETAANRPTTPALAATMANNYIPTTTGATMTAAAVTAVQNALTADGLTWNRPSLAGLLSQPMPSEWSANVLACKPLLSTTYTTTCVRTALVTSLLSANQNGLLTGLLNSLVQLVSGILGLDPASGGTPLLSTVLGPLINLLQPVLDQIGAFVSNILSNVVGIQLGLTDVHMNSISCHNSKLVY